jgi:hypothetical protein
MRAPHDTAVNFTPQLVQPAAFAAQARDFTFLLLMIDVIEFENDRVRFSTIHARVREDSQVRKRGCVHDPPSRGRTARVMQLRIFDVVVPAIERQAWLAIGTPLPISASSKMRHGQIALALGTSLGVVYQRNMAFQWNCFPVRRRWQWTQRTSQSLISALIRSNPYACRTRSATACVFVLGSIWSNRVRSGRSSRNQRMDGTGGIPKQARGGASLPLGWRRPFSLYASARSRGNACENREIGRLCNTPCTSHSSVYGIARSAIRVRTLGNVLFHYSWQSHGI